MRASRTKHSEEEVQAKADLCESRSEFKRRFRSYYNAAYKANALDRVCFKMEPLGNKFKRCVYCIELGNEIYVGLTMNPKERFYRHKTKGRKEIRSLIERGAVLVILKDFMPQKEAAEMEIFYISKFIAEGKTVLNKKEGGGLGGNEVYWTPELVLEEAKKYTSRKAFHTNSQGAYRASKNFGIRDVACAHMRPPRISWSEENVREIAKKYATVSAFYREREQAYKTAIRLGILSEVTAHMTREKERWTEAELRDLVSKHPTNLSQVFPNAYRAAKKRGLY